MVRAAKDIDHTDTTVMERNAREHSLLHAGRKTENEENFCITDVRIVHHLFLKT